MAGSDEERWHGPDRVAALDLVRGLAACAVAIPHYLILNSNQWPAAEVISIISVEVFFALSGFVLASQIVYCSRDGRFVNLWIFLVRRWMRTIPPYLIALLALSMITGQLLTGDFFRYAFYLQNFFWRSNIQDYFAAAWSLSVEEWFYVTFPLFAFCCARLVGRSDFRFHVLLAVAYIGAITAGRAAFGSDQSWDENVRRVVIFRLDSIAYGFLLYLLLDRFSARWKQLSDLTSVAVTIAICVGLGFVEFYVTRLAVIEGQRTYQHIFPFSSAMFSASTLVAFVALERFVVQSRFLSRFCLYMGKISYSIYLFHITLILLLRPHLESLPIVLQIAIYIGCFVAFTSLFYHYFERPILAARPRFKLKTDSESAMTPQLARWSSETLKPT